MRRLLFVLLALSISARAQDGSPAWKKSFVLSRAGDAWAHERFDEATKLFRSVLLIDENDETALLHLGVHARRSNQLDQAITLLTRGAAAHPQNAALQFELGVALLAKGKPALAVASLEAAARVAPSVDALVNLGDARALAGQRREAAAAYNEALALAPQSAWAHRQAGYNAFELAENAGALAHLRAAQATFPTEWQLSLIIGHAESQLGNDTGALEAYLRAGRDAPKSELGPFFAGTALGRMGRTDEAKRQFTRAVELKPNWAAARIHLGILLVREGRRADARAAFTAAVHSEPRSSWALVQLGVLELESGNPARAKHLLTRALALAPDDADVAVALGDALQAIGRPAEAAARYAEVLRRKPTHLGALVKSGDALRAQGKLKEALEYYSRATANHPTSAWAFISRGDALRGLRRLAEAKADFLTALELDAKSRWASRELGFTQFDLEEDDAARATLEPLAATATDADVFVTLGHLATRRRAFEEAAHWYERARSLDPKQARTLLALARVHQQLGHEAEAAATLAMAVALDPKLTDAWVLKGDLLRGTGTPDALREARAAYQQALALEPRHAYTRRQLGTLLYLAQQPEDAKALLEGVLGEFPTDIELRLLLGHIASARGDLALAQRRYVEATALAQGDDVRAFVFAGRALLESSRFDEADALFRRALELQPNSDQVHLERAFGQRARRDWPAAIASATRATVCEPKNAEAWLFLGRLRQETNATEPAIAAYEEALDLSPASVAARRALASALANRRPARAEDLLRAEQLLEEPLERLSAQGYTHAVAAWVRVQLWKLPEFVLPAPHPPDDRGLRRARWANLGAFAFKRAVELEPNDENLRLAAAVGLFELGSANDSRAMLAPLLKPEPGCPTDEWTWRWNARGEPSPPALASTPEQVLALDVSQLRGEAWLLSSALLERDEPSRSRLAAFCALTFSPWRADAHLRLGASYEAAGLVRLAEEHFEVALRVDPESEEARASLERLRKEGGLRLGPVRVAADTSFVSDLVPAEVLQRQAQVLGFETPALQRTLLTTPRTVMTGADVSWEHPDWKGALQVGLGYHFAWGFNAFLNDQLGFEDRRAHNIDLRAAGRFANFKDRRYELSWQAGYRLAIANASSRDEVRQQFQARGRLFNVDLGKLEADLGYELGLFQPRSGAAIRDTTAHGLNFGMRVSPFLRKWTVELGLGYRAQLSALVPSARALWLHQLVFDGRKTWEHVFLGGDARLGIASDAEGARVANGLSIGFAGELGWAWNGYSRVVGRAGVQLAPAGAAFNAAFVGLHGEHRFTFQGFGRRDNGLRISAGYDARISWGLGDVQHLITAEVSLGK